MVSNVFSTGMYFMRTPKTQDPHPIRYLVLDFSQSPDGSVCHDLDTQLLSYPGRNPAAVPPVNSDPCVDFVEVRSFADKGVCSGCRLHAGEHHHRRPGSDSGSIRRYAEPMGREVPPGVRQPPDDSSRSRQPWHRDPGNHRRSGAGPAVDGQPANGKERRTAGNLYDAISGKGHQNSTTAGSGI